MANRDIFGFVPSSHSGFKKATGSKCDCICKDGVKYEKACAWDEWAMCDCCVGFCEGKDTDVFSRATGGKCRCGKPECEGAKSWKECRECCEDATMQTQKEEDLEVLVVAVHE